MWTDFRTQLTTTTIQVSEVGRAEGLYNSRQLTFACLTALIYDHLTTFDAEVKYVWSTGWGPAQALYILNRIFPLVGVILQLIAGFSDQLSGIPCQRIETFIGLVNGLGLFVIGLILTLRVYHIWTEKRLVQYCTVLLFVASVASYAVASIIEQRERAAVLLALGSFGIPGGDGTCLDQSTPSTNSGKVGMLLIPLVIFQTALFAFTVARVVHSQLRRRAYNLAATPILTCVLKDGSMVYIVVLVWLVLVMFAARAGAAKVVIPLYWSHVFPASLSLPIAHLILNARCLAASFNVEPDYMLSHAELARLQIRHRLRDGAARGEMVVEMDVIDEEDGYPFPYSSHGHDGDAEADMQELPDSSVPLGGTVAPFADCSRGDSISLGNESDADGDTLASTIAPSASLGSNTGVIPNMGPRRENLNGVRPPPRRSPLPIITRVGVHDHPPMSSPMTGRFYTEGEHDV